MASDDSKKVTSIAPELWGPSFWKCMHWAAAGYPAEPTAVDKLSCQRFFNGISGMIPCESCRGHFSRLIVKHPLDRALGSAHDLQNWVRVMHNQVAALVHAPDQQQPTEWSMADIAVHYNPQAKTVSTLKTPPGAPSILRHPSIEHLREPAQFTDAEKEERRKRVDQFKKRNRAAAITIQNQVSSLGRVQGHPVLQRAAGAVRRMSRGPVMTRYPNSVLQRGPLNKTIVVNPSSAPRKKRGCGCGAK